MAEVRVTGLRELQKALKSLEAVDERKELRRSMLAAARVVLVEARGRIPKGSGNAGSALKVGATQRGAYIRARRADVPYYGWLDFGSRKPISGRSRSVGPWADSGSGPAGGRFIYPALETKRDQVIRIVSDGLDDALKAEGLL